MESTTLGRGNRPLLTHPLWQRVRHDPDDDDARRILGDYLCEQQERLGQLIALAFLTDPVADERRRVLERQLQQQLLADFDAATTLTFDRGMPCRLTVRALPNATTLPDQLESLLRHPALALLGELRLLDWPESAVRQTVRAVHRTGPHLALRDLTLRTATGDGRATLEVLWPTLPRLESLDLAVAGASLTTLPSTLRSLTLARPGATAPTTEGGLPKLVSLCLTHCAPHWPAWLSHPMARSLEGLWLRKGDATVLRTPLPCAAHLKHLHIVDCAVDDLTKLALVAPERFPALEVLEGPADVVAVALGRGIEARAPARAVPDEPDAEDDLDWDDEDEEDDAWEEVDTLSVDELDAMYRAGSITWTEYEAALPNAQDDDLWPT